MNASTYTLSVTPPQGSGSFTVDVDHLNGIVADTSGNALGNVAAVTQAYDIPTYTPGQATISLGEYGNLIAPVFVDGNWYYAWDMNGDGVHNSSQETTGKFATNGSVANTTGTGYQYDYMTHDVLDGIFRFASDFTTQDTDNDTDNMHRFAQINGVKLALPGIGDGSTIVSGTNSRAGTVVDNAPAGEENLTYNDLLAIWDAHNGNATGQFLNGTPAGWQPSGYWSATQAVHGYHAFLDSGSGIVYDYSSIYEIIYSFAAVQVL